MATASRAVASPNAPSYFVVIAAVALGFFKRH
jgi:hypothetical protein